MITKAITQALPRRGVARTKSACMRACQPQPAMLQASTVVAPNQHEGEVTNLADEQRNADDARCLADPCLSGKERARSERPSFKSEYARLHARLADAGLRLDRAATHSPCFDRLMYGQTSSVPLGHLERRPPLARSKSHANGDSQRRYRARSHSARRAGLTAPTSRLTLPAASAKKACNTPGD